MLANHSINKHIPVISIISIILTIIILYPGSLVHADNPLEVRHLKGVVDPVVNQEYPAFYSLRSEGRVSNSKRYHSVLRNNTYGIYSSIESCLLPENEIIFTEFYLDRFLGQFDELSRRYCMIEMIMAALTAWAGPAQGPEYFSPDSPGKHDDPVNHIQNVTFLPNRADPLDNNTIKWFITNKGAVVANTFFYGTLYNEDTNAYYHFGSFDPSSWYGSSITLVGWDDNFPKSRFMYEPPGDGAFIAKSNFGPNSLDSGFYYVSYYDSSLIPRAVFDKLEPVTNYGTLYQHDKFGITGAVGNGTTVYWGANVFTAENDQPLEAVSFYAVDAHVTCKVFVYKNLTPGSPVTETAAAVKTANFAYPGYYTVKLDNLVPLQEGEQFSVVVRFQNETNTAPICIESPIFDHTSNATGGPGQSYVSDNGQNWQDLDTTHPQSNLCIKAFSKFAPKYSEPVVHLSVEPYPHRMWIIERNYADITITIDNINDIPIESVVLWRKREDQSYTDHKTLFTTQFENGTYRYLEENLEPGTLYYYFVGVYTPDPRVSGRTGAVPFLAK